MHQKKLNNEAETEQSDYFPYPGINSCQPEEHTKQKGIKNADTDEEKESNDRVTAGWWRRVCYRVARNKTKRPAKQHNDGKNEP